MIFSLVILEYKPQKVQSLILNTKVENIAVVKITKTQSNLSVYQIFKRF